MHKPINVLFVTEASADVGGGHLMRCLTLAEELTRRGNKVAFLVNQEAPNSAPALSRSGMPFDRIDSLLNADHIISSSQHDAIILDSYKFEYDSDRSFRAPGRLVVAIDDLANRSRNCDLLIDTTFQRGDEEYRKWVSPSVRLLCGADYALLRPEFQILRDKTIARRAAKKGVERVLVSLGLTDLSGITSKIVSGILDISLHFSIDVVVGPNASSIPSLIKLVRQNCRVNLHVDPPHMAELMAQADIAVGAAGTTSWERCCLGLPTILIVLAENQRTIGRRLAEWGAVKMVSHENDVADALADLCNNHSALGNQARIAASIVDGLGSRRVADWIAFLKNRNIEGF